MTTSVFGAHVINGARPYLSTLCRLQPRFVHFLDPDRADVADFRESCPQTIVGGRIYVPDAEVSQRIISNPIDAARWAHELVIRHPALGLVDYWQVANEVCQFWDLIPSLVKFETERVRLANQSGYKVAVLNWSVGQPDLPPDDRMAFWALTYPLLRVVRDTGHVVGLHQYGAPDLWGPASKGGADWLVNRLENQVLPRLPAEFSSLRFACLEYGIDGLLLDSGVRSGEEPHGEGLRVRPKELAGPRLSLSPRATEPAGWSRFTDAAGYVDQLINMGRYLDLPETRGQVLGYALFTLGHNPPWGTYDISGDVLERLAQHYESLSGPPLPPTGGKMNPVKIYDLNGTLRDEAWLQEHYGAVVLPAPSNTGGYDLTEVRIEEGAAVVIVQVRDSSGAPLASRSVALGYPTATHDLSSGAAEVWETRHTARADILFTNQNGDVGFGTGTGSYIRGPVNKGGAQSLWILDPDYPSSILDRYGQLGGTEHRGPNRLTFTLRTSPVEPTYSTLPEALVAAAEANDVLSVNPHAALTIGGSIRDLWPTSNEFDVTFDGKTYVAQRFRDPASDKIVVLYALKGNWAAIEALEYEHR